MRILYSLLLCCVLHSAQAQCNATITPLGSTSFCQGSSLTLQASPGNVYKWFLNGNYIALLTTNVLAVNQPGSYKVVVDSMGCIDTSATIVITMNSVPPQATIAPNSGVVCQGSATTLVGSLGNSYQWLLNGTPITGATNDSFIAAVAGSYTVIVDSLGCKDTSATQVLTASAIPAQPGAMQFSSDTVCEGNSVTISVDPVPGATSYSWTVMCLTQPVMQTTSGPSLTAVVGASWTLGTPESSVYVTAGNSCGTSPVFIDSLTIYSPVNIYGMNNDPDITYLGLEAYICPTDTNNELNAFSHWANGGYSGMPTSYQWYRNNVPIQGGTGYSYYVTKGGSYKVVITTGGVCQATIQKPMIHQIVPLPVSINVTPSSICSGGVAVLNVNFDMDGYDGTAYNWWLICNSGPYSGGLVTTVSGDYRVGLWGWAYNNITQCPSSPVLANVPLSGGQATPVSIVQNGNDFTATTGFVSYQWYRYYTPIAGATGSTFTKTTWGDYSVVAVDANGCASKSNTILSVGDIDDPDHQLSLYPNPATGTFTLSANINENTTAKITITDIAGRTIQTKELRTNNSLIEEKIELDNSIPPGLYLLKLTTENYNKVVSFVKQ